ncbi:oxidoreductase [Sistotremastrum niveocremeum HHB9708]|uniref:Oxidoreductase n=1 Tax=Sistotremastrum niveocremeum HHB9708 TaxID=1314777 RepID=A0A164ZD85_9AGAM|nr:oxidoreductase [Sistotremastrum niveocremeum HHB9708]
MAPIRIALAGVGLSGQVFQAPMILSLPDLFELHTVIERNPKTPRGVIGDKFNIQPKIARSVEEALQDPEVELLVVGTPTHTHFAIAKAALEAGKHVLVDKPVTATHAEALELGALAKSKNLVLYGFQNRRWDSDYLTLGKVLQSGRLGTVTDFESHFDRYSPALKGTWKDLDHPGNGWTYDLGAHLIDQALQLFGRPEKLTAFLSNIRRVGNPAFTIHLDYPSKEDHPLTVILRGHSLTVRKPQLRYIVRGTKGTFVKYGVDVQEDQLKAGITTQDPQFACEPSDIAATLETLEEDGKIVTSQQLSSERGNYKGLYENLGRAIRNGEPLAVKWDEASQVIELIELARRSSVQGSTLEVPKSQN